MSIWGSDQGGAVPANTDALSEGATNKYFTAARAIAAALTGLNLVTSGAITAADTILSALGKVQVQITGLLNTKANLASPTFTGTVSGITASMIGLTDTNYGYSAPTTGQTIQLANGINDYTVNPAGTIAALTVNLPTTPVDGQTITLSSTQVVTVFTLTAPSGTLFNAPAAMATGQTIEYKYLATQGFWIRKR
jgi:hypothetical protein